MVCRESVLLCSLFCKTILYNKVKTDLLLNIDSLFGKFTPKNNRNLLLIVIRVPLIQTL